MAFAAAKKYSYDRHAPSTHFHKHHSPDHTPFSKSKTGIGSKRGSTYYCDHCKIPGHSIERCFKHNGYPPGFKHKRFAGCAQDDDSKSALDTLGFTSAQIDNLLALLNKHKDHVAESSPMELETLPSSANLAES
ncbi:unnamed protein product [Amaranthus hypochondriacus]